ncbi:MAG: agmatine deiminase family protein [Deltaproteobacteria bacterium]|nr:agmatine deiminase family protein [Deltaproteobacteria bacterium]
MSSSSLLNLRMPAEWEKHEATWLTWPHNRETWPPEVLPRMELFWAQLASELSRGEKVRILVNDPGTEDRAWAILNMVEAKEDSIEFFHIPNNDAWMRDHGPIFVWEEKNQDKQLQILNWDYNAWGGKYPPFHLDNMIPQKIADLLSLKTVRPHMILEGGSIDVNGQGALITSEQCLLNPNRNPSLSKRDIEGHLMNFLGVQDILWLGQGIEGDDTDGHVDDITRFVSPKKIITVLEKDPQDPNYTLLQENYRRLYEFCEKKGLDWEILMIPMPKPVDYEGSRLPASYANFYIGNEVVLVPIFGQEQDQEVLEIFKQIFPNRRIQGLYCQELVIGLGGIHCITQQQPALV